MTLIVWPLSSPSVASIATGADKSVITITPRAMTAATRRSAMCFSNLVTALTSVDATRATLKVCTLRGPVRWTPRAIASSMLRTSALRHVTPARRSALHNTALASPPTVQPCNTLARRNTDTAAATIATTLSPLRAPLLPITQALLLPLIPVLITRVLPLHLLALLHITTSRAITRAVQPLWALIALCHPPPIPRAPQ
jgi:hypothetical protein